MSDPVADLFRRAEGTTMVRARPIASVLPRQQGARRSPDGVSRLVAAVAAVAVVVAGTGLVVSRVIGNSGVRTTPPAAPSTMHSPAVVASTGSGSATAGQSHVPSGFLDPADLGAGDWAADPNERSASGASPNLVSCAGAAQLQSATGPSQTYRGITTEGGEWLLIETVIRLDPTRSAQAATVLKAMTGCPARFNQVLLAADDRIAVFGQLLRSGAVGAATGYAVVGDRLVQLETLPGGAAGNLGLPGQTQWLIDVTARAATRATGSSPSKPVPNAAAKAAAAKYRPEPGAVVYHPPSSSGPTTAELEGRLLTLADLPGPRHWSLWPAVEKGVSVGLSIPQCSGPTWTYSGAGVLRGFSAKPGSGADAGGSVEWAFTESVMPLSAADLAGAKAAMSAANRCATVSQMHPTPSGPLALTLVRPGAGGSAGLTQVTFISGSVLVQLFAYPVSGPDDAPLPGGSSWTDAVVAAARSRMSG